MVVRNFSRVLFIGAARETFLEQPLFQDPNKPTQEQIFSEGLTQLEGYAREHEDSNLQFEVLEMKGLRMHEMWEIIQTTFKIDRILLWSDFQQRLTEQEQAQQSSSGQNNNNSNNANNQHSSPSSSNRQQSSPDQGKSGQNNKGKGGGSNNNNNN